MMRMQKLVRLLSLQRQEAESKTCSVQPKSGWSSSALRRSRPIQSQQIADTLHLLIQFHKRVLI